MVYHVITTKGTQPSKIKAGAKPRKEDSHDYYYRFRPYPLPSSDQVFRRKATIFGSDEYKMLQEARRDYPGYKVTVGKTKNKEQKNAFAGLDYDYMEKYIKAHDDDAQSIMNEYLMLRGESEEAKAINAGSASFLEIRSWFLKTFPAIEAFYTKRAALLGKAAA